MLVRGMNLKSTPIWKALTVVFHCWKSRASVPSWMLLNDGPSLMLREYPSRRRTGDWGAMIRLKSLIRRTRFMLCGDTKTVETKPGGALANVGVDGFSGLASRL